MKGNLLKLAALSGLLGLGVSACAATPEAKTANAGGEPAEPAASTCDATSLSWAVGQVADEALVARAQKESHATSVRVLRPGMMVTNEFDGARLNIRVDNDRKVLATSCG